MKTIFPLLHQLLRISTLCLTCVCNCYALDVNTAPAPFALTDNAITIGSRTLTLPAGDWTLVAKEKSHIDLDGLPNARISKVYLAWVKDKQLLASVILTLPETSISSADRLEWSGTNCQQAKGYLYRDEFNSGWRTPACLLIYDNVDHLQEKNPIIAAVIQWLKEEGIQSRAPNYYVSYTKQGDRDFGLIQILFPEKLITFSADVGNWGDVLNESLLRFFERRDNQAALPRLPFQP